MRPRLEALEARDVPAFPVPVPDAVSVLGPAATFDPRANDPFGQQTVITGFTQPASGSVSLLPDGRLRFDRGPDFRESAFEYTVGPASPALALADNSPQAGARLGSSVALGDAGNLLVSGAIGADGSTGRVSVFRRSAAGAGWENVQLLGSPSGQAGGGFGLSVALSADGRTLAVGVPFADRPGAAGAGRVLVYRSTGSAFALTQELFAAGGVGPDAGFGYSVALSADGATLAAGSFGADGPGGADAGYAEIFGLGAGGALVSLASLSPAELGAGDRFGNAVAVSADGTTVAVGAFRADAGGSDGAGRVFVFGRGGNPLATLAAPDGAAGDQFGNALSLSGDGSLLAVGADRAGGDARGRVYVYGRTEFGYDVGQFLSAPDGAADDRFGTSVALSADGSTIVAGAFNADPGGVPQAGRAYRATRDELGFGQLEPLATPALGAESGFGVSVAITPEGDTLAAGAWRAGVPSAPDAGLALVLERGSGSATVTLRRGPDAGRFLLLAGGPPGVVAASRFEGGARTDLPLSQPLQPFVGPIRVAAGDFDGDGTPDRAVAQGVAGSLVRLISGATGQDLVPPFNAFEGSFAGGVFLSAGDVDGDGRAELALTPDVGGGGRVRVFSVINGVLVQRADFFGIADPAFRGGARTAIGDLDGDGRGELVVGAGFGGGPRVAVFDGRSAFAATPARLIGDFFAFPGTDAVTLRNGVFLTAADVTGDGRAELAFGGGPGGGPRVFVLDAGRVLANVADAQANPVANFFAGDPASRGGVRLAAKRVDADDRDDLAVGSGDDAPPRVTLYAANALVAGGTPRGEAFDPFGFGGENGVFVG